MGGKTVFWSHKFYVLSEKLYVCSQNFCVLLKRILASAKLVMYIMWYGQKNYISLAKVLRSPKKLCACWQNVCVLSKLILPSSKLILRSQFFFFFWETHKNFSKLFEWTQNFDGNNMKWEEKRFYFLSQKLCKCLKSTQSLSQHINWAVWGVYPAALVPAFVWGPKTRVFVEPLTWRSKI